MMAINPDEFKQYVQHSLRRQTDAINKHAAKGTYFFDYGNAFLLEASRAGAEVMADDKINFRYPSYVQDIMGPMCFDFGFGPFRWVCTSGKESDLDFTDQLAGQVLEEMARNAQQETQSQLKDNINWIKSAKANKLVVGSQARILYANAEGRIKIALAFNQAIKDKKIGPVVLGRDHHDVSGTDSPYRETSNIYDGSRFTADMAIHNVIGDSFRGATWVSIHNGGGVGWGEVINGGFGLLLDGSPEAEKKLKTMLYFDVNNGVARRAWARNEGALTAIQQELSETMQITIPFLADDNLLDELI
jgi:urocanate hydratase